MKTFRRYLLSYLLTLFLPVGILSIVISQIVLHYCAAQLLDSNAAALHQLDTAVSMQVTQFNAYVGMSVSGYVEQLRMHAAQELLAQTDSSVSQIASEVGYAQPATFMRAFKKVSGMSPTAYRTMAREQAARGNF